MSGLKEQKKKESLKNFKKEFPRTNQGLLDRVHGYHYLKYVNLYIHYMQKALNGLKPIPDVLKYPDDKNYSDAEDAVKMFVDQTGFIASKMETNEYHAKVLRVEDAKKILSLHEDLNLPDLPKTVIPYNLARKAIIKDPESIAVVECPCREARGDAGCYPRDVCLVLGEPWVSFILDYVSDTKARRITQKEALEIVQDQHERGNVQSAFFKSSLNDRLYAICNCCTCCCTAMSAYNLLDAPMFASSGYKCAIDEEKCVSCGICVDYCKFNAMQMVDDKMVFDKAKCLGCGVCESKCTSGAISIIRDDSTICEPLDVEVLIPEYTPRA